VLFQQVYGFFVAFNLVAAAQAIFCGGRRAKHVEGVTLATTLDQTKVRGRVWFAGSFPSPILLFNDHPYHHHVQPDPPLLWLRYSAPRPTVGRRSCVQLTCLYVLSFPNAYLPPDTLFPFHLAFISFRFMSYR
jgi:hypothetical protein